MFPFHVSMPCAVAEVEESIEELYSGEGLNCLPTRGTALLKRQQKGRDAKIGLLPLKVVLS